MLYVMQLDRLRKATSKILEVTVAGHIPYLLAFAYLAFALIYQLLPLPSPEALLPILREYYQQYGALALFVAAFVEAIFFLGLYFPGSTVILVAVYLAPKTAPSLAAVAITVFLGFLFACCVNYWMGRYSLHRMLLWIRKGRTVEKMREWLNRRGWPVLVITGFNPNWQSFAAVAMGISRQGFGKTVAASALGLAFWIPLWTVVVAMLVSKIDLTDKHQYLYVFALLLAWGTYLVVKDHVQKALTKKRYE